MRNETQNRSHSIEPHMSLREKKGAWSEDLFQTFGLTPEGADLSYEKWLSSVHSRDRAGVNSAIRSAIYGDRPFAIEHRVVGEDGRVRFWRIVGELLSERVGGDLMMVVSSMDITDETRSAAVLKSAEQRLKVLSSRLQKMIEDERTRIAREIHDDLGHALTLLKSRLSSLATKDKKSGDFITSECESMTDSIDSMFDSMSRIATELRPGELDHLGLVATIVSHAKAFSERTGIHCSMNMNIPLEVEVEPDLATAMFRIFQELLMNIARHSEATLVSVRLEYDERWLTLSIRDNGRGIHRTESESYASFGIIGMRERASLFGGTVNLRGRPGKGTLALVKLSRAGHRNRATSDNREGKAGEAKRSE